MVRACAIHARCHSHPIFRLLGGACVRKECDHIGVHGWWVGFEAVVPTPLHNLLDNRRLTTHRTNRDDRITHIQQIEVQPNDADLIRLVIDRQLPQPHPLVGAEFFHADPTICTVDNYTPMAWSRSI